MANPLQPRSRFDCCGGATGREILVAVIDSGWNRDLPDERILPGVGLVDPADELSLLRSNDDHDTNGHGTLCSKLILQVAPDVRILPIRVFGRRVEGSLDQIREALILAAGFGPSIVSMSLATLLPQALLALYPACRSLANTGALVVASAFRNRPLGFPALFSNVIGYESVPLPGPFDFTYRPGSMIECGAYGRLESTLGEATFESSSAAAARLAGILSLYRESNEEGNIDDAREWLADNATNASTLR